MPINRTGAGAAKKQTSARKSTKSQKQKSSPGVRDSEELLDPTSEEAKKLCGLAHHLYSHPPWAIMEETDVFGFEDPETRELGFISIMGALGQIKIVAVYAV